ncbi:MAG: CHAT domain-containing protein [Planctomycetaceae bacterium]|nr:CHAT domain-containing protein [Planctomycetales bacterium]MCB9926397.1 CHAT domain-containing protein [Planctomycetaceae bacterium]
MNRPSASLWFVGLVALLLVSAFGNVILYRSLRDRSTESEAASRNLPDTNVDPDLPSSHLSEVRGNEKIAATDRETGITDSAQLAAKLHESEGQIATPSVEPSLIAEGQDSDSSRTSDPQEPAMADGSPGDNSTVQNTVIENAVTVDKTPLDLVEEAYNSLQFQKAIELAEKVAGDGEADERILKVATLACVALNDYASARELVEQIGPGPLLSTGEIREFEATWTDELKLRQQQAASDAANQLPRVLLETDKGEIELELFEDEAPLAVNHFMDLVENQAYEGSTISTSSNGYLETASMVDQSVNSSIRALFPRVIPFDFDPGRYWETSSPKARRCFGGSVTLACYGQDKYGSELRITWQPISAPRRYDGKHTVFGYILRGAHLMPFLASGGKIITAKVTRKRDHHYGDAVTVHESGAPFEAAYRSAEVNARHLYDERRKRLGPNHRKTLTALNELGLALLQSGSNSAAVERFEELITEYESDFGPLHAKRLKSGGAAVTEYESELGLLTAEAINNYAVALYREGKQVESVQEFNKAFELRQEFLGLEHIDTIQSAANLIAAGGQFSRSQRDDCAERLSIELAMYSSGPSRTSANVVELLEEDIPHPELLRVRSTGAGAAQKPGMNWEYPRQRVLRRTPELSRGFRALGILISVLNGAMPTHELSTRVYSGHSSALCFEAALVVDADVVGYSAVPTAQSLSNWALTSRSSREECLRRLRYVLQVFLETLGEQHRYTATTHHNLGAVLFETRGSQREALTHFEKAQKIFHSQLGAQHPRTAMACETLGLARFHLREFSEASRNLGEAIRIRRKCLGDNHPLTARARHWYGASLNRLGDYYAAELELEEAIRVRGESLGEDNIDTIRSLNDFAVVLRSQGRYPEARERLEAALERLQAHSGQSRDRSKESKKTEDTIVDNLFALRIEMGDLEPAKQYFEEIVDSEEASGHGRSQLRSTIALTNLGAIYWLKAESTSATRVDRTTWLEKAQSLYKRAYQVSSDDDVVLIGLGCLLREVGELDAASDHLTRGLSICKTSYGGGHPRVAQTLVSLGLVEQQRGNLSAAHERFTEARRIYDAAFGPMNAGATTASRLLGENALLEGRNKEAQSYLHDALENKLKLANDLLPTLSGAEALAYVSSFRERDLLLAAMDQKVDAPAAYDVVWKTRALATRAVSSRQDSVMDRQSGTAASRLQEVRSELASLILSRKFADEVELPNASTRLARLKSLSDEKEQLEREVARASEDSSKPLDPTGINSEQFLQSIPEGVAIVDLVRAAPVQTRLSSDQTTTSNTFVDPEASQVSNTNTDDTVLSSEWTYHAFVLRRQTNDDAKTTSKVTWVHLGSIEPIDEAIEQWRRLIRAGDGGASRGLDFENAERVLERGESSPQYVLRHLLWEKLEPYVSESETVIVIPDGELTRLPWAALPGREPGSYLIQDYAIATASYPQRIAELLHTPSPDGGQQLLVGGVEYGRGEPQRWEELPGTLAEVDEIERLESSSGKLKKLTRGDATKSNVVRELARSRFALLATHGFFAPEGAVSALSPRTRGGSDSINAAIQDLFRNSSTKAPTVLTSIVGRNPMVLSGIVLAGANDSQAGTDSLDLRRDDGILTAEEISSLDLTKTELVVLSACDTGLGEVAGGEGVFGLQRAFELAGTRAVISTLWSIPDDATQSLVTQLYRELGKSESGKLDALRNAQLMMLQRYDRGRKELLPKGSQPNVDEPLPPFYWAAFSLSGDWQ